VGYVVESRPAREIKFGTLGVNVDFMSLINIHIISLSPKIFTKQSGRENYVIETPYRDFHPIGIYSNTLGTHQRELKCQ
jgi:hypothetical protein